MTQVSLFSKVAPTVARARRKGHAGAERAGQAAGEAWMDRACSYVYGFAKIYTMEPWLLEDARQWCGNVLPAPPDARAWGAVCRRLQGEGRIKAVGYAPARSPHGSVKILWEIVR